uniref:uncharacterized protein LOC120343412 n=1 Tax=Styela clava TaxID=7725 RepID=UPI001939FF24|nr:uncharacterized protein LOC120343412 [Styela clava]
MDALDLTTGERLSGLKFFPKGSRRKAAAPQRRNHTEDIMKSSAASDKEMETLQNDNEAKVEETNLGSSSPHSSNSNLAKSENEKLAPEDLNPVTPPTGEPDFVAKFAERILQTRKRQSDSDSQRFETGLRQFHLDSASDNNKNDNNNNNSNTDSPNKNESENDFQSPSPSSDLILAHVPSSSSTFTMDDLMQQRLRRYLDDVQPAEAPGIPERTKKQNRWAFNVWREWARKRNMLEDSFAGPYKGVPLDVGQATEEELDYWLCNFVREIRRKDGNPYPPHTLMQIVMGIQRYLRQQAGKPTICILDRSNAIYSNFRSVLDYRIKELTNNGATSLKSVPRSSLLNQSDINLNRIPKSDLLSAAHDRYAKENLEWKNRGLNVESAQGLLNAVFWHNHKTFGIQYIDDHWNLRSENFAIHQRDDEKSSMYLEFTPSLTSMMVATGKSNGIRITPKRIYSDVTSEREIFAVYEKYLSHIPKSGPFYRHPVDPTIVDRSIKFSDQWIGKNRLRAMLKHLIDAGGNSCRSKSYNVTMQGRQSISPMGNYVTPLLQLPVHHQTKFPTKMIQDNIELMKPLLRLAQGNYISRDHDEDLFRDNDSPSPKRSKVDEFEDRKSGILPTNGTSKIPVDKEIVRSPSSAVEDEGLEIAVPKSIHSITVLKGGRKITFHLD